MRRCQECNCELSWERRHAGLCKQCKKALEQRNGGDTWLARQLDWLAFLEDHERTVDKLPGDMEACGPVGLAADGWVDFPAKVATEGVPGGGTVASLGEQYGAELRATRRFFTSLKKDRAQ